MTSGKKDANDTLREEGKEAVDRRRESARPYTNGYQVPDLRRLVSSAADLQYREFEPLKWLVPNFITEGLTLLAGRPKVGKSWLVLGVAAAVASGGEFFGETCERGDALALLLEDNDRRLQRRLTTMLGARKDDWPARMTYATDWPRLGSGGLQLISQWVKEAEKPRLVVVDIIQRVRDPAPAKSSASMYSTDYEALVQLQRIAASENISIIAVHHQRKATADDQLDTVSGTTGLAGAADSVLILDSSGGDRVLRSRGRDAPDYAYSIKMDPSCWWQVLGPEGSGASEERTAVVGALRASGDAMNATQISDSIGAEIGAVRKLLAAMAKTGTIERVGSGLYRLRESGSELPF